MQHPNDSRPQDLRRPIRHRVDPFAATCPIDNSWHDWDVLNVHTRLLKGAERSRHDALRKLIGIRDLGELPLAWEIASDDPGRLIHQVGGDPSGSHATSSHVHAETTIDGERLHIDWITANRFGPARSLIEIRIYREGTLAGQAFSAGCSLGAGGSDLPAVALIGQKKAVVVDGSAEPIVAYEDALSRYMRADAAVQRPCAWLWEVDEKSSSRRRGEAHRKLGERDARMLRKWKIPEPKEFPGYSMEDWLNGVEPPPTPPLKSPK